MDDLTTLRPALSERISGAKSGRRQEALLRADAISRIAARGREPDTDEVLDALTRGETDSAGVINRLKDHFSLG